MSIKRIEGIGLSKAMMILLVVYGHLLEGQIHYLADLGKRVFRRKL